MLAFEDCDFGILELGECGIGSCDADVDFRDLRKGIDRGLDVVDFCSEGELGVGCEGRSGECGDENGIGSCLGIGNYAVGPLDYEGPEAGFEEAFLDFCIVRGLGLGLQVFLNVICEHRHREKLALVATHDFFHRSADGGGEKNRRVLLFGHHG